MTEPHSELDLKGLVCPMPIVRVSEQIKTVPVGGILRAVTTDACSMADIPAWAKSTGHEIVSAEQVGGEYHFLIRRVK